MSTIREKTTFRRGRSTRGQRTYGTGRRGGRGRGHRRNHQRNQGYRKRPKEDTNILTKQDFFNVGLLVLERKFEKNGLEDIVRGNPEMFVTEKRSVIVDTRREFQRKLRGKKMNKINSRNKVIGSVLDNLRQEEELPLWYELGEEGEEEEFAEEMLMGGFKKKPEPKPDPMGNVEDMFKKWKAEEVDESLEEKKEEKTMIVMESLLHISSDEEDSEWGENRKKFEESGLNLHLEEEFTLENLAGQTQEIEQQMHPLKPEEEAAEDDAEEDDEDEKIDLKSISLLGKIIDHKETFFDDLDKQIEQSFMISKQEESKTQEIDENTDKILDDSWKPEFKNDFEQPLESDFFGNILDDSSVNMEDMLQEVDEDYKDMFERFESNMNKILHGGSFIDDSMMSATNEDPQADDPDHMLFNLDDKFLKDPKNNDPEHKEAETTEEEEQKEPEKKELTPEEKQKRKEHFMNRYQYMITMMNELARDQLAWKLRNPNKVNKDMQPANKITQESVNKFTAHRYKIFSMLCRGCMFYKTWYYKDAEGEKHGPFMGFDMDIWNAEGILKEDFLISPDDKTYLCYDKFNERDNSIIDLMHDVIREQERIFRMNEMKLKEEQRKKNEKKGRGKNHRGRYNRDKDGRRGDRSRNYEQGSGRGYYRNDYRERNRGRDRRGSRDYYFKKKKSHQEDYVKQEQRFDPKRANFAKKPKPMKKIDEEEFPTLGSGPSPREAIEKKEASLNLKNPVRVKPEVQQTQNFKRKTEQQETEQFTEVGFENPDEIPEIRRSEPVQVSKPKEEKKDNKVVSSWDMEIKVVKKQGKKKRKKKKLGRSRKKEVEKNDELTNDIKKMLDI